MNSSALEGIRIVDVTSTLAGPYATALLGVMGAEVIHIESSTRPDFLRHPGREGRFYDINVNKLGIVLNLRHPEAVDIVKRLVKISHVVADSFRPGVMERLGLGYEKLREVKPDIIAASLSGFGQSGPERHYASFAAIFAAMSGLSYVTGYPDGIPTEIRVSADLRNGNMFAFSILAAILHWKRTGQGQYIDYSAREGLTCLLGDVILDYSLNRRIARGQGNRDASMAPHNCYRCRDDGWISIAVATDEEWQALCEAMERPELTKDERFADGASRYEHQEELDRIIEEWTVTKTDYQVMEHLQRFGVAAVPSFSSPEIHSDPHLRARGCFNDLEVPGEKRRWRVLGPPWKFSATPASITRRGPQMGEHTAYVLGELLGMSQEEIARLEKERITY